MKKVIKIMISVMVLSTIFALSSFGGKVSAASCRDIEFIYARGSGAARNGSAE